MLKTMFSFKGRIGRLEFFALIMGALIYSGCVGFLTQWLFIVASVPNIWFQLAVTTRRFHDIGMNGWTTLAAWVLSMASILGTIVFLTMLRTETTSISFGVIVVVAWLWTIDISWKLFFGRGDPAPNAYGNPANGSVQSR